MDHQRSRPERHDAPPAVGILKERKAYWSYSSLSQIAERCALQYQFQRIDRLQPEFTSENLVYGSAIHAAASWFYRLRQEGKKDQPGEIRDIFSDTLNKMATEAEQVQYAEDSSLDSLIAEGRKLVDVLVKSQSKDEVIVEIDLPFEVSLTNSRGESLVKSLVGELDLLVAKGREGHIVVKDLKTSAKKYSAEKLKHDLQPTAYLYALSQIHPREDVFRFAWDVLLKKKEPELVTYSTTRTQDDFDRLFLLAQTADRLLASGAFLPNRSAFWCKGCGFQQACDDWHRRASATISVPIAKERR